MKKIFLAAAFLAAVLINAQQQKPKLIKVTYQDSIQTISKKNWTTVNVSYSKNKLYKKGKKMETAVLGAGCFWCVEAIFQRLNGVKSVLPGYSGGHVENPTYEQVCNKNTGHVEVAKIEFDPNLISYKDILEVFWKTHDPTTLNKQGNDEGEQYRSVVFYSSEEQKSIAEEYKKKLDDSKIWQKPIVTTIEPLVKFWPAEDYHKNYFNENSDKAYCQFVIQPKVEKFKKVFENKLKNK